jgi:hypothetical protein
MALIQSDGFRPVRQILGNLGAPSGTETLGYGGEFTFA